MDGVGTFEMADKLAEQGILTCLVKTYTKEELIDYFQHNDNSELAVGTRTMYVAISIGIRDDDLLKFKDVHSNMLVPTLNLYVLMLLTVIQNVL